MNVYLPNLRLPSEYQEVEYIGRNGNNYIDTGWVPKLTSPFEVKVGCKISTSGVRYGVLSNYNGTSGEAGLTSLEINDGSHTNNVLRFYSERTSGSNSANIYSSNTLNLSSFNDIVYTNNGSSSGSVTLNGITTNGSVKTDGYSNLTAYLFIDRALRWSTYSNNSFISYCKIYENGTLVRDFVPCYRKSDSVIGLYDIVNNQFYTNAGTGTFSKGNDVTMSELKNAYIGEVWTPGSNTIAYYPLESDGNDYSGNGHNLTWNSSPSYGVSGGTKSVVNLGGNKLGRITNLSGTYTNYTFNVWCKSVGTGTWQEIFDNFNSNGSAVLDAVYFNFNGTAKELGGYQEFAYQYRPNGGTNAYQNVYSSTNRSTNTWYNICVTSTSSGIKLYINGTQVASNSTTGAIILDSGKNCIGGRYDNGANTNKNFFNGYLSEFIFESKTWTATEISDYYNNTKSNYGL